MPTLKSNLQGAGKEVAPSAGEVERMRVRMLPSFPACKGEETDTHTTGSRAWQLHFGFPRHQNREK